MGVVVHSCNPTYLRFEARAENLERSCILSQNLKKGLRIWCNLYSLASISELKFKKKCTHGPPSGQSYRFFHFLLQVNEPTLLENCYSPHSILLAFFTSEAQIHLPYLVFPYNLGPCSNFLPLLTDYTPECFSNQHSHFDSNCDIAAEGPEVGELFRVD